MNANPNKIIAALLDIVDAAYAVVAGDRATGAALTEVSTDELGTLQERLWRIDQLPQPGLKDEITGPARARWYLESFLVGDENIASLIEKRTRQFPPMTVTIANLSPERKSEMLEHLKLHSGGVIRGGMTVFPVLQPHVEFEPTQTWQAPATGPGFTSTAEFPTIGPINHDFYTHRQAWRDLIVRARHDTALHEDVSDHDADRTYIDHELAAFDRAFATLPPETERRMRERMIEPTFPVVGKEALIDATRPLFVKAMKSKTHRTDLDRNGKYIGVSEYRFEGWCAAVEAMGFKPASDDIGVLREQSEAWEAVTRALDDTVPAWRTLSTRGMFSATQAIRNMASKTKSTFRDKLLADTADAANKIINDAGLLANLFELCGNYDEVTIAKFVKPNDPWSLSILDPSGDNTRLYQSTSFHQVIVVAHKGERDLHQPEHEECAFCGFTVETPCEAPPPAECPTAVNEQLKERAEGVKQANEMQDNLREHGTIDKPAPTWDMSASMSMSIMPPSAVVGISTAPAEPTDAHERRKHMVNLLVYVKERFDLETARHIIAAVGKSPHRMSDIADSLIEDVIAACEAKLKQV